MSWQRRVRRFSARVVIVSWSFLITIIAFSVADAAQVRVDLEKESLALPLITVQGAEYLSLESLERLAKAIGNSSIQQSMHGSFRMQLGSTSIAATVGSPEIRVGGVPIILSESPTRFEKGVVAPLELLPIALSVRYGEGRVHWDPDLRVAGVSERAYSLRLLRFRAYSDHTRVVLEGTRPHDFALREDGVSGRVVLVVKRGIASASIRSSQVSDGLIASIDVQQLGDDTHVTIQGTGRPLWGKAFAVRSPDRIVIDLYPREEQKRHARQPEAAVKASPGRVDQRKAAVQGTESTERSSVLPPERVVKTVVIDPGHGGRDAGAIGPSGLKEKDIVLDIGLRLQRLIEEKLGMEVILTRSRDVFVPLESRTMIANRHRADFFISLHVNAAPRSGAVGFETYFLSREPSDRGAGASAVRENTVLNLEGIGQEAQRGLKTVLWDLTQTFYVRESSELAELLLNELVQSLRLENRGVKSAPFFVLIGAAMPSVLVEVAFITNPQEEQRLEQEAYRQQIAEALLAGIGQFKARYTKRVGVTSAPPPIIARPTTKSAVTVSQ